MFTFCQLKTKDCAPSGSFPHKLQHRFSIFDVCSLSEPVSSYNCVQTRQVDNEVIYNVHSSTHLRECYSSECWYTCRDRDGTARARTRGRALLKVSGKRLYKMEVRSHCRSKISDRYYDCDHYIFRWSFVSKVFNCTQWLTLQIIVNYFPTPTPIASTIFWKNQKEPRSVRQFFGCWTENKNKNMLIQMTVIEQRVSARYFLRCASTAFVPDFLPLIIWDAHKVQESVVGFWQNRIKFRVSLAVLSLKIALTWEQKLTDLMNHSMKILAASSNGDFLLSAYPPNHWVAPNNLNKRITFCGMNENIWT